MKSYQKIKKIHKGSMEVTQRECSSSQGWGQSPGARWLQVTSMRGGGCPGQDTGPQEGGGGVFEGDTVWQDLPCRGNITRTNCSWQVVIYCQDNAKRYWKQKKRGSPACVGADS